MHTSRFLESLVRILAVVCCLAPAAASAGGLTLVHPFQENTQGERWAFEFADCVNQSSKIPVEVLSPHYFGNFSDIGGAVERGILDMAILPVSVISEDWPALGLYSVPGVLEDPGSITHWSTDTDVLETIDELTSGKFGMFVLGFGWQYQLLALTSDVGRLDAASGLNGLKIRAIGGRQSDFLADLGASPVRLPAREVPYALSAGAIDGAVMSLDQLSQLGRERQFSMLFWPNKNSPFAVPLAVIVSAYADLSWRGESGRKIRFDVRNRCATVIDGFNQKSIDAAAMLVERMRSEGVEIVEDDHLQWYSVGESLLEAIAVEANVLPLFDELMGR